MQTILAKCENCGGALRIASGADSASCVYCGATSFVRGSSTDADAPKLRVDPPPPISSGVPVGLFLTAIFGALAALVLTLAVFQTGGERIGAFGASGVLCIVTLLAAVATLQTRRGYLQEVWFRDNALPARATVREIAVTHDGSARMALELQIAGQNPRQVEHTTGVPSLLIPRLTQGLSLPVIVHPNDPSKLEVQWHLV